MKQEYIKVHLVLGKGDMEVKETEKRKQKKENRKKRASKVSVIRLTINCSKIKQQTYSSSSFLKTATDIQTL